VGGGGGRAEWGKTSPVIELAWLDCVRMGRYGSALEKLVVACVEGVAEAAECLGAWAACVCMTQCRHDSSRSPRILNQTLSVT